MWIISVAETGDTWIMFIMHWTSKQSNFGTTRTRNTSTFAFMKISPETSTNIFIRTKTGESERECFPSYNFSVVQCCLKTIQAREERQMDEGGPCIVNVYSHSELCSDFHIFLLCNAVRMKLVKIRNWRRREILAVHYCLHRWKRLFRILHSYYKHICFWQQPFLSVQITVNNEIRSRSYYHIVLKNQQKQAAVLTFANILTLKQAPAFQIKKRSLK